MLDLGCWLKNRRPTNIQHLTSNILLLHLSQEVEIAAQIRLRYVLEKHAAVSAIVFRSSGFETLQSAMDLLRRDQQLDLPPRHVELNFVAVLHHGQRSA